MNNPIHQEQAELHAYVDEQLSVEERGRVESGLESDPEARERVEDYRRLNDQLRQLFDPVLSEPIPAKYLKIPRESARWWKSLRSLAAAFVLLCIGLAAGLYIGADLETAPMASNEDADHFVREAAVAYSVYTPEVRHPVEVPGDQRDHLVKWLSKRIGHRINAPLLDKFDMKLLGGRLLASDDGPGALLMYENINGSRIILIACRSQEAPTALRYAYSNDVSVFYWVEGSIAYAIAAKMARKHLLPLARSVYHQTTF